MARMKQELSRNSPRSELAAALAACRIAFLGVFLFSGMIGILALTSTFFVLEIYDRVVPNRSFATLIGLSVLAAVLFIFLGVLDFIRGRLFVRIAAYLDERSAIASTRRYVAVDRGARAGCSRCAIRPGSLVSCVAAAALFDAPFLFLFIFVCFLFHVWLGLALLFGALVLIALTLLTESLVREPTRTATTHAGQRYAVLEASRRNAEILRAMGMTGRLFGVWSAANRNYGAISAANDLAAGLGGISRIFRMMLQAAVLAISAYLVIEQQASGGIIFAATVLLNRALAPIDLAIGNWKASPPGELAQLNKV
jgi:ATP-binding cassette subfamily C protein